MSDRPLLEDEDFFRLVDATWELDGRVFGRPTNYASPLPDVRPEEITQLVDHLLCLSLSEPDDPSHPWWLGHVLRGVGRKREAAAAYLWAAHLDAVAAREGTSVVDDPLDWRLSALELAAELLEAEGLGLSAERLKLLASGTNDRP